MSAHTQAIHRARRRGPRPATSSPGQQRRPRHRTLLALAATCAALLWTTVSVGIPADAATTAPDTSPVLEVSMTGGLDPTGQTVTVTGSNYDPAAHVGTRPPLAGRASGVYVVVGRFGSPWQPSQGAPTGARQIITQVWAVPQDAYASLNPTGSNPEIVLLESDGTFSADLEVSTAPGEGAFGIATYAASGAVDAAQEVFVALSFASPTTTSTTVAVPPTTIVPTTSTTTTSSTVAPTTSTAAPPATSTNAAVAGNGSRSADGSLGQRLTVTPADDLPVEGASVRVAGSGFDPAVGVYVALCVDQGAAVAPSPCVGGVDMEGAGASSAWVSSNPPDYAGELASPFGPAGSFDVTLTVNAADEYVNCLAEATRCVVATRADHTAGADRSADVRVPVTFHGQTGVAPAPVEPTPTISLGATTISAGSSLEVTGNGFLVGEQVQVWLLSEPTLLTVATADAESAIRSTVTIPATTTTGVHHVELRGLTSGRTIRSTEITVTAAAAVDRIVVASPASSTVAGAGAAGPRLLALTGGDIAVFPALLMIALGVALVVGTRRRTRSIRSSNTPGAHR